jgi:hypothetical protein
MQKTDLEAHVFILLMLHGMGAFMHESFVRPYTHTCTHTWTLIHNVLAASSIIIYLNSAPILLCPLSISTYRLLLFMASFSFNVPHVANTSDLVMKMLKERSIKGVSFSTTSSLATVIRNKNVIAKQKSNNQIKSPLLILILFDY